MSEGPSFSEQALAVEVVILGKRELLERVLAKKIQRPDEWMVRNRTVVAHLEEAARTLHTIAARVADRQKAEGA